MSDQSGNVERERPDEREPVTAVPEVPYKPRKVKIDPVENGFIVEVGCKKFVAEKWKTVSEGLELYFRDPEEAQKKFCK